MSEPTDLELVSALLAPETGLMKRREVEKQLARRLPGGRGPHEDALPYALARIYLEEIAASKPKPARRKRAA